MTMVIIYNTITFYLIDLFVKAKNKMINSSQNANDWY